MIKTKTTLLTSFALILATFYLGLADKHDSSQTRPAPGRVIEDHPALEATLQILVFPSDVIDALGLGQNLSTFREALSKTEVSYRYASGLGTLVNYNGELILITHDHWGGEGIGAVQFRNAAGDPLLEIDGATFKSLIRYQDGGTMILGRSIAGDRSDYLSALIEISQSQYNHRITPAELGSDEPIHQGSSLIVAHQGRDGSNEVELIEVIVEEIEEQDGQLVYQLRCAQGGNIMPGDSGGGLWLGGRLVGNMWKSKYIYAWNWDSLALEEEWTEISYAAALPEFREQVIHSLGTIKTMDEVDAQTSGGDF